MRFAFGRAVIAICLAAVSHADPAPCPGLDTHAVLGYLADPRLKEVSGLVLSRKNRDVFWVHNDSGDTARLFALRPTGRVPAEVTLQGITATDWEDMAIGPGPVKGRDYLYVADFGNNCECRGVLTIHRCPEPTVTKARKAPLIVPSSAVESFPFRYADRPNDGYNAEALLVDPWTGKAYVVTKQNGARAGLYEVPLIPGSATPVVASRVGDIALDIAHPAGDSFLITAGDVSASGEAIVLITYTHGFLWRRAKGESIPQALARPPCALPPMHGDGPEAVALAGDGRRYFTTTEGVGAPLYAFAQGSAAKQSRAGTSRVFDDFEDGDSKNRCGASGITASDGAWEAACDTFGESTLRMEVVTGTGTTPSNVLHVAGRLGKSGGGKWAWAKCRTTLLSDGGPASLGGSKGIRFRARSARTASVRLQAEGIVGGRDHTQSGTGHQVRFLTGPEWRTYEFFWPEFVQPSWACPGENCTGPLTTDRVKLLSWTFTEPDQDIAFDLDDVSLTD